ncbi:CysE2 [Desulforapulum autotrophicum HRM2]|uniref:CysE2 n=1 Tax=Desulforapulum autotrophicum (strain ATCC 43914 / DSM 3382 / VKM B-1955 / HRM2) TaxID=177437 RepID=C0QGX9_DESAH|nr:serine acetyltransferase [Desulforapulum autotrophicum]ACN15628.1 CysE2 [Desulforapulum autotrophicum HRM2]
MGLVFLYRLSNFLYKKKIPVIPKIIQTVIRVIYACYLPYSAEIGPKTVFLHGGLGVVIHEHAKIGANCVIMPNVTIGGTRKKKRVPVIGDNVKIGTGAKIIGGIDVGSGVVIAANSVVIKDLPDRTLVAGVPAQIKKVGIDFNCY